MGQPYRKLNMYEPAVFHIRIQGELDESWAEYFAAESVFVETDHAGTAVTVLVSGLIDQATLVGMVNHLNALGIPLLSVECRQIGDTASMGRETHEPEDRT